MSSNIRLKKTCQECGIEFIAKTTVTKNCSDTCAKKAYKRKQRQRKIQEAIELEKKVIPQQIKNPEINQKEVLSIKELCDFVGISKSTAYRLFEDDSIKTIKLRSRVFITRKEIKRVFDI
ncbi:helix-turn-helix domain-containing protein [Aquimarina sp. U1-2]|uniref:helix-turn-helix domain-containing protein n=1 Tax=Aquimarina sp. U1-2 TaxID=2823141 RepID=UPI001AECF213|nr:helix-turn-helix domain-containing protein [Aquimarina sp. U1-2]MBP2833822.1 helix-turn-helix domain-containing protein [Aquimarina sp. U1-2]